MTAGIDTLLGLAGAPAGELGGSESMIAPTLISATTVDRIACAANVVRVLLGPDSAVVDVGRARRVPAGATRTALAHRDQGCVWPGCDRPATWTEPHHLQHWSRGGMTELSNLVLLCHRHHWMVHEGGWRVARTADGGGVVIPPLPDPEPMTRGPDLASAA